jgi:hypothetical protein
LELQVFEDSEWLALINRLTQLTTNQVAKWEIGGGGDVTTTIAKTEYLMFSVDSDDRQPYALVVRREERGSWRDLARLESGPLDRHGDDVETSQALVDLYALAHRMALGGPQLVQELLAEMDSAFWAGPAGVDKPAGMDKPAGIYGAKPWDQNNPF